LLDLGHRDFAPLWDAKGSIFSIVGEGALWNVADDGYALSRITRGQGLRIVRRVTAGRGQFWSFDKGLHRVGKPGNQSLTPTFVLQLAASSGSPLRSFTGRTVRPPRTGAGT
jgi:hypothetical protein